MLEKFSVSSTVDASSEDIAYKALPWLALFVDVWKYWSDCLVVNFHCQFIFMRCAWRYYQIQWQNLILAICTLRWPLEKFKRVSSSSWSLSFHAATVRIPQPITTWSIVGLCKVQSLETEFSRQMILFLGPWSPPQTTWPTSQIRTWSPLTMAWNSFSRMPESSHNLRPTHFKLGSMVGTSSVFISSLLCTRATTSLQHLSVCWLKILLCSTTSGRHWMLQLRNSLWTYRATLLAFHLHHLEICPLPL